MDCFQLAVRRYGCETGRLLSGKWLPRWESGTILKTTSMIMAGKRSFVRLVDGANILLRRTGLALVPHYRMDPLAPVFSFRRRQYEGFCHRYNCGYPPLRMTERSLELALADVWLEQLDTDHVTEIGAVTPYYWPRRVSTVVDPYDSHPLVTHRVSLFALDFSGRDVLAISTLEHISVGDYGPANGGETPVRALEKICRESRRFLITVPYGYNAAVDDTLFADYRFAGDVSATYMVRSVRGNDWREASAREAAVPYGRANRDEHTANGLLIIERGGLL
jgi:hypothetical protein